MTERRGIVDLRSDTVTRPSAGMRDAIARAEVGDDALREDPTVNRLQERGAELLGMPAALFFPSGVMANQTALLVHASRGSEVVLEANAHIFDWEDGAAAAWAGVQLRPVATADGMLTVETVERALRPRSDYQPQTALVCVENTHLSSGGRVMALDTMREIRVVASSAGVPVHLDGARLWNASAGAGIAVAAFAGEADTVMVSLSKGLGCPAGALLAGEGDFIERAWRIRRRLGGAMRQAGILAAAGLYALEHNLERLEEDHANARLLARLAAGIPGIGVVSPETNIVMIDVGETGFSAEELASRVAGKGVRFSVFSASRLRAVTHLDVDAEGVERAAVALRDALL